MLKSKESFAFLNSKFFSGKDQKSTQVSSVGEGEPCRSQLSQGQGQSDPHNNWESISTHFFLGLKLSAFLRTFKIFLI